MRKPGFFLALFATCLAFVVVLLGAYTRLAHAGLGCPDWPGCYGFVHVPLTDEQLYQAAQRFPGMPVEAAKGWSEMIHRYCAGTLGLLIAMLALQAIKRRSEHQPLGLPLLLLTVLSAQAFFGMWTVTLRLWPQVVTVHLLGGFTTLSLLFLLTLRLSGRISTFYVPLRLCLLARAALVLVIAQIVLGGWVSSNYASMACLGLPTCNGAWWPSMDFSNGFHLSQHIGPNYLGGQLDNEARTAIHFSHRLGAITVSAAVLMLTWQLLHNGLGKMASLLLVLLTLQVCLGLSNVVFLMPLRIAVAHNGGGALLMLALVLVNFRLRAMRREIGERTLYWTAIPVWSRTCWRHSLRPLLRLIRQ
ncbi:heme A synthase [Pseudomonas luteola]